MITRFPLAWIMWLVLIGVSIFSDGIKGNIASVGMTVVWTIIYCSDKVMTKINEVSA